MFRSLLKCASLCCIYEMMKKMYTLQAAVIGSIVIARVLTRINLTHI